MKPESLKPWNNPANYEFWEEQLREDSRAPRERGRERHELRRVPDVRVRGKHLLLFVVIFLGFVFLIVRNLHSAIF